MNCNFGDSYSTCNIIFEDGLTFGIAGDRHWFYNSTNFNGNVTFQGTPFFNNSTNFFMAFENCKSFNKPFNFSAEGNYFPSFMRFFQNAEKLAQPVYLSYVCNNPDSSRNSIITFEDAFYNCYSLKDIDIDITSTDVKSIICGGMFVNCGDINVNFDLNINSLGYGDTFDIRFVSMFAQPNTNNSISPSNITFNPQIHGVSQISNYVYISFYRMFLNCTKFDSSMNWIQNSISIFDDVEELTCASMFANCFSFNQPINMVTNANFANFAGMFINCNKFNAPLNINVSANKVDCYMMFFRCREMNQSFDIPNNTVNCAYMFASCKNFNQPITIPNSVTNCYNMFAGCNDFNQDLYVPDSVTNFKYIMEASATYTSFISIPTVPNSQWESFQIGYYLGIYMTANFLGATYLVRDSGKTATVISYVNSQGGTEYKWSDT